MQREPHIKTERTQPSVSQGERSQKKAAYPHLALPVLASGIVRKCVPVASALPSVALCYSSQSRPQSLIDGDIFYCKHPSALDFVSCMAGLRPNGTPLSLPTGNRGCFSGPPAPGPSSRSSLEPCSDSQLCGPAPT